MPARFQCQKEFEGDLRNDKNSAQKQDVENTPSQLASRRVCAPCKEGVENQAAQRGLMLTHLVFATVLSLCVIAVIGAILHQ
jgi:hypothetical protein